MGFCGADIKALCAEAALVSLRRCYPQVYSSDIRLNVDPSKLVLRKGDFCAALTKIQASSARVVNGPLDGKVGLTGLGKALDETLYPLLASHLVRVLVCAKEAFPVAAEKLDRAVVEVHKVSGKEVVGDESHAETRHTGCSGPFPSTSATNGASGLEAQDRNVAQLIHNNRDSWVAALADAYDTNDRGDTEFHASDFATFSSFAESSPSYFAQVHIEGPGDMLVALGLLHYLGAYPQFSLSLPAVIAGEDSSLSPEQALTKRLQTAYTQAPSVVYLPDWKSWMESVSPEVARALIHFLLCRPDCISSMGVDGARPHRARSGGIIVFPGGE